MKHDDDDTRTRIGTSKETLSGTTQIFSMSINQFEFNYIEEILFRNNEELIQIVATNEGGRESASATVITECNAGDQVFVMVSIGGYFDGSASPCYFTGYFLQKL